MLKAKHEVTALNTAVDSCGEKRSWGMIWRGWGGWDMDGVGATCPVLW